MSLLGRVFRNSENLLLIKNWSLASAVSWNEGVYFSKKHPALFPVPPKRPLSAYMLFVKEKRKELQKENTVLRNTEQIKLLAKRWMDLSSDYKKPYELQAREIKIIYGEEHKKYYENLSEQQKEELSKEKSERRKALRVYRLNKALRESGFPKHAMSPYAVFVHSLAIDDKSDMVKSKDFIKQAAEKWKTLSENEKKSFEKQATDDKERYLKEMTAWKEKLLKEGNEKLLKEFSELKYGGKAVMSKIDGSESKAKTVTKSKETKSTNAKKVTKLKETKSTKEPKSVSQ